MPPSVCIDSRYQNFDCSPSSAKSLLEEKNTLAPSILNPVEPPVEGSNFLGTEIPEGECSVIFDQLPHIKTLQCILQPPL